MKIINWCVVLVLVLPSLVMMTASGSTPKVNEDGALSKKAWVGYYIQKSDLCTDPIKGESCAGEFNDFLNIEVSGDSYLVSLRSTQAGQHLCYFSFKMHDVDGALFYKTKFGDVIIKESGDSLEIVSLGLDPTAFGLAVCGAHADINGLKFPLRNRLK